jgi:hypothetical protein
MTSPAGESGEVEVLYLLVQQQQQQQPEEEDLKVLDAVLATVYLAVVRSVCVLYVKVRRIARRV